MNLSFFYKVLAAIVIVSVVVLYFFMHFRKNPMMIIEHGERGIDSVSRSKVLVVHSYQKRYGWTDGIDEGINRVLDDRYFQIETFYMDTKQKHQETSKINAGSEVRKLADLWNPDLVIAVDDNAQKYFAAEYALATNVPIVFCGVNNPLEEYGYPRENVTGVIESPRYRQTVDLFKGLMPGLKRTYVLTDTSESSTGLVNQVMSDRRYNDVEIVKAVQAFSFSEWKEAVREAGELADLLVVYSCHLLFEKPDDERIDPERVMLWTLDNTSIPVTGFTTEMVKDNVLGGIYESSLEQGMMAASLVVDILNGKSPGDIPVVTPQNGLSRLNVEYAKVLGLRVDPDVLDKVDILVGN